MSGRTLAVIALACGTLWAAATPARAQAGSSEVTGEVKDTEGNPVPAATVTLTNVTNKSLTYTVKTNKKGRYYIPNLLYNEPGEWDVTIEAEGFAPRRIAVESRKSDRTLVGKYETGMSAEKPHKVLIKAFGKAQLDFTMVSAAQQAEEERQRAEEAAAKAAKAAGEADPFAVAAQKVSGGDLEGSLPDLRKAVEAAPEDPQARELLAKVLFNLERYPEAEKEAKALEQIAPDRPGVQLLLADIYAKQEHYDQARAALAKARANAPDDVSILRRIAFVAERQGDDKGAIEANEAIVAKEPDNVESWLVLGDLYAEAGQLDKSGKAYTRVVELDPSNAYKTFFNIGALIENKPNPSPAEERRALEAFRKAVEINPGYAKAHRHLGYALLRKGDLPGARKELERYLELEPDAADSADVRALVSNLPRS